MQEDRITTDVLEVLRFVQRYVPVLACEKMNGLGLKDDKGLALAVLYERWTSKAVWLHTAKRPDAQFSSKRFLSLIYEYPFIQVGVEQLFGWVDASNEAARNVNERMGFKQLFILPSAATDGGDAIIYRMTREDCRFMRIKEVA